MKKSLLSEEAYGIIKKNLTSYEKGKYLSARSVANEIGMSYTPVRDAFSMLEKEGLIKRIPSVGYFVTTLDIQDVIKIYQARECIEVFVLNEIFDSINDAHIHELEKYALKQKKELEMDNIHNYIKFDNMFHNIFLNIYNNEYLFDLIDNLRERYMFCSKKIATLKSIEGITEHYEIIAHIKKKNKKEAIVAMKTHIDNTKHRMKEGFIRG